MKDFLGGFQAAMPWENGKEERGWGGGDCIGGVAEELQDHLSSHRSLLCTTALKEHEHSRGGEKRRSIERELVLHMGESSRALQRVVGKAGWRKARRKETFYLGEELSLLPTQNATGIESKSSTSFPTAPAIFLQCRSFKALSRSLFPTSEKRAADERFRPLGSNVQ